MFVDDAVRMRELVERLADAPIAALDTESNGMHAFRERVCLLQISLPGLDVVIDPLAVSPMPLAAWLADRTRMKILHAADNDVRSLRRDWDLQLNNVFDTMLAARALAWPAKGLGDILAAHFGCATDKRWQRHDWSQRPLAAAALEYARTDTRHLAALRELQHAALVETGRLDDFEHACQRLTELIPRPRVFDPQGWAQIDGARELDDVGRATLAELYVVREHLAGTLDRAPYRILGESVLLELARLRPATRQALIGIRGVGGPVAHRFAPLLVEHIARAVAGPAPSWPAPPARPDKRLRERFDALRDWRRAHAATRGLEPDMLLSKDALNRIAELDPPDAAALAASGVLDAWELQRYADPIVAALARVRR